MLKIIAGIIVGFLVMAVLVAATFGITMMVLGLEQTFQPNSWWTTNTFNVIVLVGGTIAAIIGGLVCGLIARSAPLTGAGMKTALCLAAILIAMGVGSFVMNNNKPDPPARAEPVTLDGIKVHGKEPTWFAISKTLTGAIGVLLGAAMVKRRPSA